MNRKDFLKKSIYASALLPYIFNNNYGHNKMTTKNVNPLAISMWDFSWIERRWSGAGYENWDKALDELVARGYNALRIDAFPHLINSDKNKEWTLKPVWRVQDWGSPGYVKIKIQPYLNEFLSKCADRKIRVGLSSWFREDLDNTRMKVNNSMIMGEIWNRTLNSIKQDGLLDILFYVDLCNEWPGSYWAPYFKNNPPELTWGGWHTEESMKWMEESIKIVRKEFPEIPLGYSIEMHNNSKMYNRDLSFFDYQEPHIWMANSNNGEFYNKVGYKYDTTKYDSYDNLVLKGEKLYSENPEYWDNILSKSIEFYIKYSKNNKIPLMTTECWGVVDYKDWPMLNWQWIKDLCELGTRKASKSGRWVAIATSNFCGPQFKGMWNDIEWHQKLTDIIKKSTIDEELMDTKLINRIGQNDD